MTEVELQGFLEALERGEELIFSYKDTVFLCRSEIGPSERVLEVVNYENEREFFFRSQISHRIFSKGFFTRMPIFEGQVFDDVFRDVMWLREEIAPQKGGSI